MVLQVQRVANDTLSSRSNCPKGDVDPSGKSCGSSKCHVDPFAESTAYLGRRHVAPWSVGLPGRPAGCMLGWVDVGFAAIYKLSVGNCDFAAI